MSSSSQIDLFATDVAFGSPERKNFCFCVRNVNRCHLSSSIRSNGQHHFFELIFVAPLRDFFHSLWVSRVPISYLFVMTSSTDFSRINLASILGYARSEKFFCIWVQGIAMCATLVFLHAPSMGFEPTIFSVRGRCPKPLDDEG